MRNNCYACRYDSLDNADNSTQLKNNDTIRYSYIDESTQNYYYGGQNL